MCDNGLITNDNVFGPFGTTADGGPSVAHRVPVFVKRLVSEKVGFDRFTSNTIFDAGHSDRSTIAANVVYAYQACIGIHTPSLAIFDHIQGTIGAELQIDWTSEFCVRHKRFKPLDVGVFIQVYGDDPVTRPLVRKQGSVICGRKFCFGWVVFVEVINGTGACRSSSAANFGKNIGVGGGIIDHRRFSGRQLFCTGVVNRFVDRMCRILGRADRSRDKVDDRIRCVVADEIGPAIVAGRTSLIDFVVTSRATITFAASIGTNVAPVQIAGLGVDTNSPRVATPHHVDLGMPDRAVFGKQIAVGDGVSTIRFGVNPQHFAIIAFRVPRRSLRIPGLTIGPLVNRCVSVGIVKGIGVVAGSDIQISVGPKLHRSRVVTTLASLFFVREKLFLALHVQVVLNDREPTNPLAREIRRRILQVNPVIFGKIGIECQADQSVLLSRGHTQFTHHIDVTRLRIDPF